jgi:hypothetical protein
MLMMMEGGPQTGGWKGSTLNYRKIQGLECDAAYLAYLTSPLYRAVVEGPVVPPGEGVAVFRSMFFNKPSAAGREWSGAQGFRLSPLGFFSSTSMQPACNTLAVNHSLSLSFKPPTDEKAAPPNLKFTGLTHNF